MAEIGAGAAEIGNPAGAVVKALKAATDAPVHHGATSQDAVDTAMMLVVKRALVPLLDDLRGAADAAARARQGAPRHADHGPHAAAGGASRPRSGSRPRAGWCRSTRPPTTCTTSGSPTSSAARSGTLEPLKLDLGLDAPLIPWHTLRGRVGELAGALGVACGAIGKAARDVTLMPEVRERVGGGSTSMPHKHNPVAAISALGCARQAPGLVATLLAAMEQELERAAGAWHSEWAPLNQLLVTTGSAASWLRTCLETLEVHPELGDADTGAAALLVDRALEAR